MRQLVFRAAMLAVFAGSMTLHIQALRHAGAEAGGYDLGRGARGALAQTEVELLDNPVKPPKLMASAVLFRRSGCDGVSYAVPLSLAHDGRTVVERTGVADAAVRYIFADSFWVEDDRIAIMGKWLTVAVLSAFGQSAYAPVKYALVIVEPSRCADAAAPDWSRAFLPEMLSDKRAGEGEAVR